MRAWLHTPVELLIGSFICAGLGVAWLRWYYQKLRNREYLSPWSADGAGFFVLAVALAGLAGAFAWYGRRTVSTLGRRLPLYPHATYEWCIGNTCEFQTKDKPQDVIAYYQHTPTHAFPQCEQLDADRLVLRGTNKRVRVWIREDGGETKIDYDIGALRR